MAKFEDTPEHKRRMVWDPNTQQMRKPDRAPSNKQTRYLRDLAAIAREPYVRPVTAREAQAAIDDLKARIKRAHYHARRRA